MNTKKNKGKSKSNKPSNPNTPQKIEEPSKDVEIKEEVGVSEVDSAQKSDIRVPEIISEVITPAVDVKEKEDDSPKKPKRNRGKKKKHDKDEDDTQEEKPAESVDIIEIVEVETQEIVLEENVAPSARKKKNKNKKAADSEAKVTEKVEKEISDVEQKKTEETTTTVKKEETVPQEVSEQEVKQSKKKNKKKKRNDSERSEKAEELSCTSAFQQLLKEDKTEIKTGENQPTEKIKTLAEAVPNVPKKEGKDTAKESPKVESLPLTEEVKETTEVSKTPTTNESGGKNKKKNKKDKKEPPREKELKDEDSFDMPEIVPITDFTTEVPKKVEIPEAVKKDKTPEELGTQGTSLSEDVKPKAKIAKPVEKKQKGQDSGKVQDHSEVSTAQENESNIPEMSTEEKRTLIICELQEVQMDVAENKSDLVEKTDKQEAVGIPQVQTIEIRTEIIAAEQIEVPELDKNKKRKKSPKPGKQEPTRTCDIETKTEMMQETNTQIQPQTTKKNTERLPVMEIKSEDALITEAFEELIRIPESDKSKKRKKSPKPIIPQQKDKVEVESIKETVLPTQGEVKPITQIDPKIDQKPIPLPAPVVEPPKNIESKVPPMAEHTKTELLPEPEDSKSDDTKMTDTKSKKKRKKSPKPPQEPKAVFETKEPTQASEVKPEKQEKKLEKDANKRQEEISQGLHENIFDIPLAEDIEIQSLKADESEGSTCGFTPDIIQHPRATSQDLIDDNNNMLIQEITVEEVKLQIPTDVPDTPFIQGSGETPLSTPECMFVGVQISEIAVPAPKVEQEKTDIKSKMMEVNQDMEELRLSIERSLAELTAIEKSEGEIEKKFEEKTVQTPVPKSPEVKISMPSDFVFKSQTEKVETNVPKEEKMEESVAPFKPAATSDVKSTSASLSLESQSKDPKRKSLEKNIPEQSTLATEIEKPSKFIMPPVAPARKDKSVSKEREVKTAPVKPVEDDIKPAEVATEITAPQTTAEPAPPAVPARKDHKNKGKNKKKGKQDSAQTTTQTESTSASTESKEPTQETAKKEEKTQQKSDTKQDQGKQHSNIQSDDAKPSSNQGNQNSPSDFDPIENFEDAMTSSADDINKTFEMIANDAAETQFRNASHLNPEIKIVAPIEDTKPDKKDEKVNPVSPPKNLLGHPDIPVPSNRADYKKEKNKAPNTILAKVKIKDAVQIEEKKQTKDTQTDNIRKFMKNKSIDESFSSITNENDEFVYKYSFRKVFLQSACHVCKKELKQSRVPCNFCNLIFYCNAKHKDEDWNKHQGFCFAVSTIVHLKDQKHIYADSKNITGQDYRLLRMQMIVSCEKVLKRKLTPCEQEALLYPRVCADPKCREWRQGKLADCDGCGQISYCSDHPDHFPKSHQRWCKSYSLYQKLVCYQQTKGRLEPKLPGRILTEPLQVTEKMNEVLAAMYEEKIDMNDIQYAALTQIATAPLTAAYCLQTYGKLVNHTNGTYKKSTCTIHIVGGELQFEADALNKWEVFFLHLKPDLQELRVVMIGRELNPSNLPLELLGKVKLCENCRVHKRRVVFSFQDKTTYHDYWASDAFISPDIVCAFNPSIKRSSMFNGNDPWPKTINCVLKLKAPFLVTAYTMNELQKDLARIKDCSEIDSKIIIEPKFNSFASVRPDRNFISDDEMPLLFKNYCYSLVAGGN